MRQIPIFVQADGDRVAAVVTAPESPRGLVLLLAGTGRHNAIGGTLAARMSVRLAEEGLASCRLDYAGSGDSPGRVERWNPAEITAASAQARALLDVARRALVVDRFAGVATCYGSRIALGLTSDPSCAGAVCLAPPLLDFGGVGKVGRGLRERRLGAVLRSSPALRRLVVAPARRFMRASKTTPGVLAALGNLERTPLVFLYGGDNGGEDHYSARAAQAVEAALRKAPAAHRERFELRRLGGGPLTTFDGLPREEQDAVLDVVVPYVNEFFGAG